MKINVAPEVMKDIFRIVESPHALRNETKFKFRILQMVRYGIEKASFVGSTNRGHKIMKHFKILV